MVRPSVLPSDPVLSAVARFLDDVRPHRVVAACSGGPDSVALLVALKEAQAGRPVAVTVGHVNHALRGRASDGDAAFVRRLAAMLRFPIRIYKRPVRDLGGNLEEAARDARYEALAMLARRVGARFVLTAHTRSDQAETVLLNLIRGCGPDGLAGMSAVRAQDQRISIARPLLGVDRQDILRFLRTRGQAYRKDASNADTAYLRNYLRTKLLKDLETRSPGVTKRLARLADMARDDAEAWDDAVTDAVRRLTSPLKGGSVVNGRKMREIPVALQRRLLRRVAGRDLLTFDGVERLRHWMHAPPTGGRFWQLRKGWTVERLSRSKGSPTASLFWFHRTRSRTGKRT